MKCGIPQHQIDIKEGIPKEEIMNEIDDEMMNIRKEIFDALDNNTITEIVVNVIFRIK